MPTVSYGRVLHFIQKPPDLSHNFIRVLKKSRPGKERVRKASAHEKLLVFRIIYGYAD